jgi:hypothetical protein
LAALDDATIRQALEAHVADVKGLLAENTQQGRAVLRALLAGPISFEPIAGGRRGFRFRGELAIDRLIASEVSTSPTGSIRGDTCAASRARARRGSGCLALAGASSR